MGRMARPGALPVAVPSEELRRHTRFGTATFHGTLWLVNHSRSATAAYEPCPLLNLSYCGVGFRSPRPLRKGAVCWVLVEVTSPFKDAALATIRVCCSSRAWSSEAVAGARFLQTNKGWIGDEEQVLQ
jgi:hypothetical protein